MGTLLDRLREAQAPCLRAALAGAMALCLACRPREPEETQPATPSVEIVRPATREVLSLMPEEADVALAIPNPAEAFQDAVAVCRKLAPASLDVDAVLEGWLASASKMLNVEGAAQFSDVARARGLDPRAPAAVFIAWPPRNPPPEQPPAPEERTPRDEAPRTLEDLREVLKRTGEQPPPPSAPPSPPKSPLPPAPTIPHIPGDVPKPVMAAVLRCAEPGVARRTLEDMFADAPGATPDRMYAGATEIRTFGKAMPCYFIRGNRLIVGTSLDLLKGIAGRLGEPMPTRYGTPLCPAHSSKELVLLTRLRPRSKNASAPQIPGSLSGPLSKALNSLIEPYRSEVPMVTTLRIEPEFLTILTRQDMKSAPGLRDALGLPVEPAHLAVLPEDASAAASFAMTGKARERLQEIWLDLIPDEVKSSTEFEQVAGMVRRITGLLRGEITVAAVAEGGGPAALLAFVDVADVAEAKEFLVALGLPGAPFDAWGNVNILAIPQVPPLPVSLHYAFVDETLIACSRMPLLKATLERCDSAWHAPNGINTPATPLDPQYRTLVAENRFLEQTLVPGLAAFGVLDAGKTETASALARGIEEIRWRAGLAPLPPGSDSPWRFSETVVRLK